MELQIAAASSQKGVDSIRVRQLFSSSGCENLVFALCTNFIFVKTKPCETEPEVGCQTLHFFVREFLGRNQDYFSPGVLEPSQHTLAQGRSKSPPFIWHNSKLDESHSFAIVPIVEKRWSLTEAPDSDGKGRKLRDSPRRSDGNHNESDKK